MRRVLAAPDKFRGTASALEVSRAIAEAAEAKGWTCDEAPVADGGEGTLEVFPGRRRTTTVTGPLGQPVDAEWLLDGTRAVIEMARASGIELVGGAQGNDPMAASTYGTGELVEAALDAGATEILVGMGGSASTDGGLGAIRALEPRRRLRGIDLLIACDVDILFVDAAEMFAPQKGATPAEVSLLRRRLERLAQIYLEEYGVDVRGIPGSGAAGGLAGGMAAVGARLVPGFELVAETIGLVERIEQADLVVTGEGLLDEQSFNGKAVGGVVGLAAQAGVRVVVIAGETVPGLGCGRPPAECVSLVERFGHDRALTDTLACVAQVVEEALDQPVER